MSCHRNARRVVTLWCVQGSFAKVYKARCTEPGPHFNELVAIKALRLEAFMSSLDEIYVRGCAPVVALRRQ